MSANASLILAGGAGTRLWPLSTDENPKQFLRLFGGRSLLQHTYSRLALFTAADAIFVSTNERYRAQVIEQLPQLPEENILLEPSRRNTGPAIAVCCREIFLRLPSATLAIFPSDQFIKDDAAFAEVVERGIEYARGSRSLVTIGLVPDEPSTGFGYLELSDSMPNGLRRVSRFIEKPDRARAQTFFCSGHHLWNGGMFIWTAKSFDAALQSTAPEIARLSKLFVESSSEDRFGVYEQMPSISIDYAVMEKFEDIVTVPGDFGWSDVGSWKAVAQHADTDLQRTNLFVRDCEKVYVHSELGRRVAVVGLKNVIVVDAPDGLLILNADDAESLASLVKEF